LGGLSVPARHASARPDMHTPPARMQGVSVVARLSRCLEELALVERRLNDLPWPNLRLVQGVAAGLDAEGQVGACLRAVRCKGVRVGRHVAGCWLGFTGRGSHAAGGGSR
jgi:hypothetical protein